MLVEFRCKCGYRTVFPGRYDRHVRECEILKKDGKECGTQQEDRTSRLASW